MADPILRKRLLRILEEDLYFGDLTTEILARPVVVEAEVFPREECVLAGVRESLELAEMFEVECEPLRGDGERVKADETVLELHGKEDSILVLERSLLNILSRMSGISTLTSRFAEEARLGNPDVKVAATRKTAPGLRWLDKRAVELGGGDTHRMALHDCVLIKDNHVRAFGDVSSCVQAAKGRASFVRKIEVEVSSPDAAAAAAEAGADIVMLDNMSREEISAALDLLKERGLRDSVTVEASGNVSLEEVRELARLGVDVISIGLLTHSPRAIDFKLRLMP